MYQQIFVSLLDKLLHQHCYLPKNLFPAEAILLVREECQTRKAHTLDVLPFQFQTGSSSASIA